MNFWESIQTSIENLYIHKLRSFLTMLGMIFGVGAVISMTSIGAGAEEEALRMIDNMGIRNIIIKAKAFDRKDLEEIRENSLGLSLLDLNSLKTVVPGVERAAARKRLKTYETISDLGQKVDSAVYGVDEPFFHLSNFSIQKGVFFNHSDQRRFAQVCVIGREAAKDLFGFYRPLGRKIKVNNVWFTVIGILSAPELPKDEFQGVKIENPRNQIFLPIQTVLKKIETGDLETELDEIILKIGKDRSPAVAALLADGALEELHNGEEDFEIVVPEALMAQSRKTQWIFNVVMQCIAGISLLVGGIGIMNIMLANILERTREIGIRRAVGARQRDIRNQFLVEAVTISVFGGILGIGIGFLISFAVAYFAGWHTAVTLTAIVISFGISSAVGIIFGSYPAVRASRLDPIEALRNE